MTTSYYRVCKHDGFYSDVKWAGLKASFHSNKINTIRHAKFTITLGHNFITMQWVHDIPKNRWYTFDNFDRFIDVFDHFSILLFCYFCDEHLHLS